MENLITELLAGTALKAIRHLFSKNKHSEVDGETFEEEWTKEDITYDNLVNSLFGIHFNSGKIKKLVNTVLRYKARLDHIIAIEQYLLLLDEMKRGGNAKGINQATLNYLISKIPSDLRNILGIRKAPLYHAKKSKEKT